MHQAVAVHNQQNGNNQIGLIPDFWSAMMSGRFGGEEADISNLTQTIYFMSATTKGNLESRFTGRDESFRWDEEVEEQIEIQSRFVDSDEDKEHEDGLNSGQREIYEATLKRIAEQHAWRK